MKSKNKLVKLTFDDMIGDLADCSVRRSANGESEYDNGAYKLYLNGQEIPAVMSHHLKYGDGFPRVVIEVALKSYETDVHGLTAGGRD